MQEHSGFAVVAEDFLSQLDRSSEFLIPETGLLTIKTKNSLYQFDLGSQLGRGGYLGEDWVDAIPSGATFGGSMIMLGRVLIGSFLEFNTKNGRVTTSQVQDIGYRTERDM